MLEFKCEYIVGFPSSVYRICKFCESQEIKFNGDVKVFFPTAETVTPEHRKVISRFFKCDIKDQYASSEGAPFIFECRKESCMKILQQACLKSYLTLKTMKLEMKLW